MIPYWNGWLIIMCCLSQILDRSYSFTIGFTTSYSMNKTLMNLSSCCCESLDFRSLNPIVGLIPSKRNIPICSCHINPYICHNCVMFLEFRASTFAAWHHTSHTSPAQRRQVFEHVVSTVAFGDSSWV